MATRLEQQVVRVAVGDRFESTTMVVFQYVEQHLAQRALGLRHLHIPKVFVSDVALTTIVHCSTFEMVPHSTTNHLLLQARSH